VAFNPPLAPHFGCLHVTITKAATIAIHTVIGSTDIKNEELMTTFAKAEALINFKLFDV
jgi:hypothetical protein